jgi:hypothetical protein
LQTSGVSDNAHPASRESHSDFRIPKSEFELTDTLFAHLDERAGTRAERLLEEERPDDEDESLAEPEDAWDVWSTLYGLK